MSGVLRRAFGFGHKADATDQIPAASSPTPDHGTARDASDPAALGAAPAVSTATLVDITALDTADGEGDRGRRKHSADDHAIDGDNSIDGADDDDDADDETLPRRRWPFTLALFLVVALVVGAVYVVAFSPVLALRSVVVNGSGADSLSVEVRAAVGLADGTPLLLVDIGDVHDRVAAVGPVASVTVQRQWPHTLVVTVSARAPVAVTQANGRWWLLDATGKPYQTVSTPPGNLLPIELSTPAQGDRATLAALGVLGALPPSFRSTVASISAPTAYDISLRLDDGRTVKWGSDTDNALKIRVLPGVLARPGRVFDISDPTLVTVR